MASRLEPLKDILVVRLSEADRNQLYALAASRQWSMSATVRELIRAQFAVEFPQQAANLTVKRAAAKKTKGRGKGR